MSSVPKELRGDYDRANRGETRVFVSHGQGKAERDVVSVLAGYRYKKQSEVDFSLIRKVLPCYFGLGHKAQKMT